MGFWNRAKAFVGAWKPKAGALVACRINGMKVVIGTVLELKGASRRRRARVLLLDGSKVTVPMANILRPA